MAHQPSLAYIPYLVTGDYYYLEEMWFWSGWNLASGNRGVSPVEQGWLITEQTRGMAWAVRNWPTPPTCLPTAALEKAYITQKINNNLTYWLSTVRQRANYPCIRYWESQQQIGADGGRPDAASMPTAATTLSPWQDDFVLLVLGHIKDIGFDSRPADQLARRVASSSASAHPGFNWFRGAPYHIPAQCNNGGRHGISVRHLGGHQQRLPGQRRARPDFANPDYPTSYTYIARARHDLRRPSARRPQHVELARQPPAQQVAITKDPTWAFLPPPLVGDINRRSRST